MPYSRLIKIKSEGGSWSSKNYMALAPMRLGGKPLQFLLPRGGHTRRSSPLIETLGAFCSRPKPIPALSSRSSLQLKYLVR